MSYSDLQSDILKRLTDWKGFSFFSSVMEEYGVRAFTAGGAVRDAAIERNEPPKDFDFFLQGKNTKKAIKDLSRNGEISLTPYGSPRWFPKGEKEQYADLIPISDFRPGLWPCEDIMDVLNQFDFTANAIAYDIQSKSIINPQNGLRDAKNRLMRMVRFDYPKGPYIPNKKMDRNAILWFRITHYASTLEFDIEPITMKWLKDNLKYKTMEEDFIKSFFRPNLKCLGRIS